jgi:hypothetical protein
VATRNGTRFELELVSTETETTTRAVYRAVTHRPEGEYQATVEVTKDKAAIVSGETELDPALAQQLVAIARTVGKHAEHGPWPRRIHRWRNRG